MPNNVEIGHVAAIFRYPVKSMRGEPIETARLGWHGIAGDRRLAFRRLTNRSAFPWLTATTLPELLLFAPEPRENDADHPPTHMRTPNGERLPILGEELAADVERRYGRPVQMMQLRQGIFDDAAISVIVCDTVEEVCRLAHCAPDVRRFRPNILVRPLRPGAFQEDAWIGSTLSFGGSDNGPKIAVTMHDVRCAMINLDPDSACSSPQVLKAAVRANGNNAGVYGAVIRVGEIAVGESVALHRRT